MTYEWEKLLRDYQVVAAKWLSEAGDDDGVNNYRGRLLADGLGLGKALALNTPIPTPNGWRTMASLRRGDMVFGADGHPCRVTATFEVPTPNGVFDVRFSDGEVIRACGDHLWKTFTNGARRALGRTGSMHGKVKGSVVCNTQPEVRSTRAIKETLHGRNGREHAVEMNAPLHLPPADLPLDPYLLGVWLGDGHSREAAITIHKKNGAIARAFKEFEPKRAAVRGNAVTWRFHAGKEANRLHGTFVARLRSLGVFDNKHVPEAYFWGSPEQRLALLQGLMDTDGTISTVGTCCFDNTNERLVDAVMTLLASLGVRCTKRVRYPKITGRPEAVCAPCFRVNFTTTLPVFRHNAFRKARLPKSVRETSRWRYIDSITPVDSSEPMRCITVDSPENLYLCGRTMVVTHNTRQALAAVRYRYERKQLDAPPIFVTTASARIDWMNEARRFWPELVTTQPGGAASVYRRRDESDEHFLARTEGAWRAALEKSDPLTALIVNYENMHIVLDEIERLGALLDVVVVDEAHNLKNQQSKYAKEARQFPVRARLLLTATPVDNYCEQLFNLLDMCGPGKFGSFSRFAKRYFHVVQGEGSWGSVEIGELTDPDGLRAAYSPIYLRRTASEVFKDMPARMRHLHRVDVPESMRMSPAKLNVMVAESRKQAEKGVDAAGSRLDKLLRECVKHKFKAAVDFLKYQVSGACVLYTYKKEDADKLHAMVQDAGFSAVLATGDVPVKRRMQLVEEWKEGKFDHIVATMDALRESATLVRAKTMLFLDLDWRFVKVLQCEGRIDPARQPEGERCPVDYHYFLTRNGPDEVVAEALLWKIRESQKLLKDGLAGSFGEFLGPLAAEQEVVASMSEEDLLSAFVARATARHERMVDLGL